MAIRYVDFLNGNDSNNGTTFALRKKTLASASAGLNGGDTIRIMKSPDPTSLGSCTWANNTNTITLPGAVTAHINTCEVNWTGSANVTPTLASSATNYVRYGSNYQTLSIAAAFTTGKIAYAPSATTDLSAYQQVSFMIVSNVAIAAGTMFLDLCSDATGDVPIVSFTLPGFGGTTPNILTFDNGSALPSNVNSIALRVNADPGTASISCDHFIACKAPSAADSLTLNSIIGLNTVGEPEWYAIRSINGATVELELKSNWGGSTGSLTTYKIEPIRMQQCTSTLPTALTSGSFFSANGSTATSYLNLEYGWNETDMSTQTGFTAFDCQNMSSYGNCNTSNMYVNNLIGVRFYIPFASYNFSCGTMHMVSPYVAPFGGQAYLTAFLDKYYCTSPTTVITTVASNYGMLFANTLSMKYLHKSCTSNSYGIGISNKLSVNTLNIAGSKSVLFAGCPEGSINNFNYATSNLANSRPLLATNTKLKIETLTISNSAPDYLVDLNYDNCVISVNKVTGIQPSAGTFYAGITTIGKVEVFIQDYYGTGECRGTTETTQITSVTSPVHTAGGTAWKYYTFVNTMTYPYASTEFYKMNNHKIAQLPVKANVLCTVSLWVQRTATTGSSALFVKPETQGISDYVVAKSTAAANTWEQLTITFTPTVESVVDVYFGFQFDGNLNYYYIDDFSFTQA